jgi:hypothetical protein
MKHAWLFFVILLVASCTRIEHPQLISPSGNYQSTVEVAGKEAGTRRNCVSIIINDLRTNRQMRFQTGAADTQKWAIGWSPEDVLVLYSSDIGTYAYEVHGNAIVEKAKPTATEIETGRLAYEKTYGYKPRL